MGKFLRFVFGPGCAQNSRIRDISAIRLFWAHPGSKINRKKLLIFFSWLCLFFYYMGLWGVRQTAAERWAAFGPQPALRPGEGAGGMEEAAGAGASSNNTLGDAPNNQRPAGAFRARARARARRRRKQPVPGRATAMRARRACRGEVRGEAPLARGRAGKGLGGAQGGEGSGGRAGGRAGSRKRRVAGAVGGC